MESETKQLIDDIKSTSAAVTEYINKYYDKDAVSYYHFTKIIEILENVCINLFRTKGLSRRISWVNAHLSLYTTLGNC